MGSIVAKRYASALFSLAVEDNEVDIINSEVLVLKQSLENNKEFISLINHPQLNIDKKVEMIKASFGDIHQSLKGLIHVMLIKNRFSYKTIR